MSLSDDVLNGMLRLRQQHDLVDGVLVATDCLFPSNGVVQVSVRSVGDRYMVSDDGSALREVAHRAGPDLGGRRPDHRRRHRRAGPALVRTDPDRPGEPRRSDADAGNKNLLKPKT